MMGPCIACTVLLLAASSAALRLDAALVDRGLCGSRAQAKAAVQAGRVTVDGKVVKKVSHALPQDLATVILKVAVGAEDRYVSRAGEKLRAALDTFNVGVVDAHVLDVGASTGGFTHVLLERGAASAVCVDCGHGQLHPTIQEDMRVTSLEGVNARTLSADALPRERFDCIVIDVSFISLRLVLPAVWPLLDVQRAEARCICLVKPQFEAGREAVSRGKGLVRDAATQRQVLSELVEFVEDNLPGCSAVGSMASPITGGDGQEEFLLALAPAEHAEASPKGPFVDLSTTGGAAGGADVIAAATTLEASAAAQGPQDPYGEGVDATLAAACEEPTGASDAEGGLVPMHASRPPTAASRSSKYARQKEGLPPAGGGSSRSGATAGKSHGHRGRKHKQHRQA